MINKTPLFLLKKMHFKAQIRVYKVIVTLLNDLLTFLLKNNPAFIIQLHTYI